LTTPDSEALDRELLDRLRRREGQAFERLAELYGASLTRVSYLYLSDAHAAEDVCQETLLAAWNAAGRMNDQTRLRPWLFGILFNQCRKYRRSLWRRLRRERDAAVRPGGHGDGSAETERLEALRLAIGRLDDGLRAVVILRYEQGFSVAQAAEALGLPQGTVKSRTFAATEKLRALVREPE
jgi:RNA polymerase sigma-70 factor, ECF subfamily